MRLLLHQPGPSIGEPLRGFKIPLGGGLRRTAAAHNAALPAVECFFGLGGLDLGFGPARVRIDDADRFPGAGRPSQGFREVLDLSAVLFRRAGRYAAHEAG